MNVLELAERNQQKAWEIIEDTDRCFRVWIDTRYYDWIVIKG